jgi:hypothetical protein
VPTVLDKLWCGHISSVSLREWLGWCEMFGKCPAVLPYAMADGESGSNLKLGSCVDRHRVLLGTRKLVLENVFKQTFAYNPVFRK